MITTQAQPTFRLGPDGPEVGTMGIGTWAWGNRWVWGYGGGYTDSDLRTTFEIAINNGICLFDTAEVYGMGRSEQLVGEFASAAGADIAVATKFFPFPWRFGRVAVVDALRRSLDRLEMEHVALYQLHWPSPLTSISEMAEGLADCVEAGLAQAVGVSNYSAVQMRKAQDVLARRGVSLASNQVAYNLLDRSPERNGVLEACRETDTLLIAYSPMAMGMLTGKYGAGNRPSGMRGLRYSGAFLKSLEPLIGVMREIGEDHGGRSVPQVALNWVIGQGALPIPGAKRARQVDDNIGALGWTLTEDEMVTLRDAANRVKRT
jgi:aryl-alcohol dehydrogenase-like predicted oxidoreductase